MWETHNSQYWVIFLVSVFDSNDYRYTSLGCIFTVRILGSNRLLIFWPYLYKQVVSLQKIWGESVKIQPKLVYLKWPWKLIIPMYDIFRCQWLISKCDCCILFNIFWQRLTSADFPYMPLKLTLLDAVSDTSYPLINYH